MRLLKGTRISLLRSHQKLLSKNEEHLIWRLKSHGFWNYKTGLYNFGIIYILCHGLTYNTKGFFKILDRYHHFEAVKSVRYWKKIFSNNFFQILTSAPLVTSLEVTKQPLFLIVITSVRTSREVSIVPVGMDMCWCTTRDSVKVSDTNVTTQRTVERDLISSSPVFFFFFGYKQNANRFPTN